IVRVIAVVVAALRALITRIIERPGAFALLPHLPLHVAATRRGPGLEQRTTAEEEGQDKGQRRQEGSVHGTDSNPGAGPVTEINGCGGRSEGEGPSPLGETPDGGEPRDLIEHVGGLLGYEAADPDGRGAGDQAGPQGARFGEHGRGVGDAEPFGAGAFGHLPFGPRLTETSTDELPEGIEGEDVEDLLAHRDGGESHGGGLEGGLEGAALEEED